MTKETAKGRLVEAACQIMLSKGYSATSVDEICEMADASKGSFYHFFTSKEGLALAVLDHYYRSGLSRLLEGDYTSIEDPVERCLGFLEHVTSMSEELWAEGCLLGNFALDITNASSAARNQVARMFDGLVARIAAIFDPALTARGNRDSPTPEALAEHLLSVIEGSIVLSKAHQDTSRISGVLRGFTNYVRILVA